MATFRILVVDDHEVVRFGVRSLLDGHEGWQVCGEAADGREAVEKTAQMMPDLVVLDLGMPRMNGLEAARQILHHNPRQRILILTNSDSEQMMRAALWSGVRGFLLKSDPACDLVAATEALLKGRTFFTSRMAEMVLAGYLKVARESSREASPLPGLTAREREVIQLIAEGSSTKEVAAILSVSVKTAETHRTNIMCKLRLHSVSDLVLYAVRNDIGLVSDSRECCLPPAKMSWQYPRGREVITASAVA
jgi:DNA-binding NarL/FixJ family response regulator